MPIQEETYHNLSCSMRDNLLTFLQILVIRHISTDSYIDVYSAVGSCIRIDSLCVDAYGSDYFYYSPEGYENLIYRQSAGTVACSLDGTVIFRYYVHDVYNDDI